MGNIQFSAQLMEALDDPEIREKLRGIFEQAEGDTGAEPQLRKLRGENARLCRMLEQAERERDQETEKRKGLERAQQALEAQLRDADERLKRNERETQTALDRALKEKSYAEQRLRETREEQEPFRPLIVCYQKYRALPKELLGILSRGLPSHDPMLFWAAGSQRERLFQLWDAVAQRAERLPPDQIRTIVELLEFFLGQYNALWSAPVYELMVDEAGKPFDSQRHARSSDCSLYQGTVAQVLLPGIWAPGLKRAEKKCIVRF